MSPPSSSTINGSGDPAPAVRVLGFSPSPFVTRVLVALKLKGVEYELLEEKVGTKSELLLRSNPIHKKVPVLLYHGKPISESLIIVEYIDEVWASNGAPAILPRDPHDRAVQRFWAQYIDDKIPPAIRVLRSVDIAEEKEKAVGELSTTLQYLEEAFVKCSQGKNYFGGDNIGYLDIALGGLFGWIKAVEKLAGVKLFEEAKVPNLISWADRFRVHPAVMDVLVDADILVDLTLKYITLFKALDLGLPVEFGKLAQNLN
uniref:glutathione transferase n=1 Tax=Leersia perrieri TaxID=77586 RepID=A0A0D9XLS0_9ORYZ